MIQKNLMVTLETEDFKNMMLKYHFRKEDFASLQSLSCMLVPLLRAKAYYVWKEKGVVISY